MFEATQNQIKKVDKMKKAVEKNVATQNQIKKVDKMKKAVEKNKEVVSNDYIMKLDDTKISNILNKDTMIKNINQEISNLSKTKTNLFNDIFRDFRTDFNKFAEQIKKENSLLTKKQIYVIYGSKLDGLKLNTSVLSIYKSLVTYYSQNNINIDFKLFENNSSLFVKLMDIYNLCFNIKELHKLENKKIVKYSFELLQIKNIFDISSFKDIKDINELKKFINNINDIIKAKFNQFKKEVEKNEIIATYEKTKNGLNKKTKRVSKKSIQNETLEIA